MELNAIEMLNDIRIIMSNNIAGIMNEEIDEAEKEGKSYTLLSEFYKSPRVIRKLKERLGLTPEQASLIRHGTSNIDSLDKGGDMLGGIYENVVVEAFVCV